MDEIIKKWNEWWVYGKVPEGRTRVMRNKLLESAMKLVPSKEIVAITGVRRSGKSTLLYQMMNQLIKNGAFPKNILYFNFDEPLQQTSVSALDAVYSSFLELNNPKGRQYIFFDEVQNIPQWERWMKTNYDLKGNNVKFIITGSNTTMLSSELSKLLSGRMIIKTVFPLSFAEFLDFRNVKITDADFQKQEIKHYLAEYAKIGGFPEAVMENDENVNRQRLKEYFDSILMRDIVITRKIRETAKLSELSQYVFTNIASPLSYNKISKAIGLNINTLKEYLHFMEQAYLIIQVNFFSYSLKESISIQKQRKIYCIDNGMRNAVSSTFSKDTGKLVENLVLNELKRRGSEVYYWKGQKEVDFIVKDGNQLAAINVSYEDAPKARETEGLLEFAGRNKSKMMIITNDFEGQKNGIYFIPLWKWLLQAKP